MKFKFIFILLILPALLMAQPFNYEFRGNVKNYRPGQKMYFMHFDKGKQIDSAIIENGSFVFKGKTNLSNEPDEHYAQSAARLYTATHGKRLNFEKISDEQLDKLSHIKVYLEPGITQVKIVGSIDRGVVTPPRSNSGRYRLDSIFTASSNKFAAFEKDKSKFDKQGEILKQFEDQWYAIGTKQTKDLHQFIRDNPSSPVSLYIMLRRLDYAPLYEDIAPYYEILSPKVKQTKIGIKYGEYLKNLKNLKVGKPAPAFTLNTPAGKPVSLSSYKGKYLVVDFWASWCIPCREETPELLKLYKKFKGQNFDVLSVSLDKDLKDWKKAIADDHLPWTQVADFKEWSGTAVKLYAIRIIPQCVLIDPEGNILARVISIEDIDRKLSKIFLKSNSRQARL